MSVVQSKGSPPAPVGPHMNAVPAGTGVPFPGNNNPRREQETKLAFILAAKPSCVGFSFYSLAI